MFSVRGFLTILIITKALLACPDTGFAESDFWATWGDGKAEVSAYRLLQPRYGQIREGTAVLVFVAEPFLHSTRVKPEPGITHPENDVFYVFKLNHVRDFQTGIYDYNIMTSSFLHVDPVGSRARGTPTKITFSSQEWCGNLFEELLFDEKSIRNSRFSYFDGEADQARTLEYPEAGVSGDALFSLVRGVFGELVEKGQSRSIPFLPTLLETRLNHRKLAWTTAKLSRSANPIEVEVPLGKFKAEVYTLESQGRPRMLFYVEVGGGRRLLRWKGEDGEMGEITGSERLKYWQLNRNGDESYLEKLGAR